METTKEQDETGECGVTGDRSQPVVVQVEQQHLWLGGTLRDTSVELLQGSNPYTDQNQITELLHLHASLEGKLELAALDDDVGEVK